jgi:hypothetical protein
MADKAPMSELDNIMQLLGILSHDAKAAGDTNMMYAANRAWRELHDARQAAQPARAQPEKR